jgi:hypothetical protein
MNEKILLGLTIITLLITNITMYVHSQKINTLEKKINGYHCKI